MKRATLSLVLAAQLFACRSGSGPAANGTADTTPTDPSGTQVAGGTAAAPSAPEKIQTIEGITEYRLGNGLQVLLFPDTSKDTVTVNVTYKVGSRHEGYGETGMAHLLEHMMFKGSKKYADIWKELNERGAQNNASTWVDRTNYFEIMPASEDNLTFALDMEADRMVNALIRREDLDTEFSVVRNEFEMGENNPAGILSERVWSTAYLWHNYGKSTIGSRSDIEKVQIPSLRAFYEKYYQPDNAVLVVAGKFDEKKTLELINKTFGVIPKPTRVLAGDYTIEPVQDGEREVTLRRSGGVQIVAVLYHVMAGSEPDFAAVDALGDILTRAPSGRLYQALVKTGMATSVDTEVYPLHDPGAFGIVVEVPLDKPVEPVRKKLIEIVENIAKGDITEQEVMRYRVKAKKDFKLAFTDSRTFAIDVSEAIAMGDWRLIFLLRDHAQKVTAADIKRVAGTYLVASNRTLGQFLPDKTPVRAPLTERPDVSAMVKDYKGGQTTSEGEKFEYTIANIEKRTERGQLSGGLKYAFLPKENRGDAVTAELTLRFGTEKDFKGKMPAVGLLGQMLMRGTKQHSYQELRDELDVLEARVGVTTTAGAVTVSISTLRGNLPAVLTLVHEILREPTFPADEFATIQKERLATLETNATDPQAMAVVTFMRTINPRKPDDVDYQAMPAEGIARLKAVKVADVKAVWSMLGASHGELVIVGDFDAGAIKATAEKLFGAWKSPKPYARIVKTQSAVDGTEILVDVPDKENALMIGGFTFAMRDDDPDMAALEVVDWILGGGGFSSRLMIRLRQKDGISYGAGSQIQVDAHDPVAALVCFAILAPQNVAKGLASMMDEIKRITSEPIAAEEVEAAKKGYVKQFENSLSDDDTIVTLLGESLEVGRGLDYYSKLLDAVAKITPEQASAAAKKWINPAKVVRVVGLDKKKAEAGAAKPAAPAAPATK